MTKGAGIHLGNSNRRLQGIARVVKAFTIQTLPVCLGEKGFQFTSIGKSTRLGFTRATSALSRRFGWTTAPLAFRLAGGLPIQERQFSIKVGEFRHKNGSPFLESFS